MTEARQKAEDRLAKELGAEYEAETGGVYFTNGTSILVREILWKALVSRELELEKYRSALQQFADCDLNDENCASLEVASMRIRAIARRALPEAPKEGL